MSEEFYSLMYHVAKYMATASDAAVLACPSVTELENEENQ